MMPGRHVTAAEMDSRLARIDMLVGQLTAQLDRHETWHRDMLVDAAQSGSARRTAVWALVISAAASVAALLTAAAAMIH